MDESPVFCYIEVIFLNEAGIEYRVHSLLRRCKSLGYILLLKYDFKDYEQTRYRFSCLGWMNKEYIFLLLDSILVLTTSENCALSMVPADKRTEKERKRNRIEPTVCGSTDGELRILSVYSANIWKITFIVFILSPTDFFFNFFRVTSQVNPKAWLCWNLMLNPKPDTS